MPEQLDIFGNAVSFPPVEPRAARQGGRGGSAAAAKVPDKPEKFIKILEILARRAPDFPMNDGSLVAHLPGVHPGTVSKRRLRLERAGLIEVVPGVMAPTRFGVEAMTFRITDKGKQVLAQWQQQ